MATQQAKPQDPLRNFLVGVGTALVSTAVVGTVSMFMLVREDNARHEEILKRLEKLFEKQELELVATRDDLRSLQQEVKDIKRGRQ